eukprot:gnl/MRDRNA2_/MRDRNA2_77612_c0_seq2.p1 gnl/MRDRNA2_/MRDRNA2_77612_c0~~gnl/MRDRNA2_/MRDRNA2_77612_c0_seq2.p1  ORF type:complete len:141 (-),score=15.88 gnl/MRDRNA2_/MRDRNA2_77612_c0_seq2:62-484(-)
MGQRDHISVIGHMSNGHIAKFMEPCPYDASIGVWCFGVHQPNVHTWIPSLGADDGLCWRLASSSHDATSKARLSVAGSACEVAVAETALASYIRFSKVKPDASQASQVVVLWDVLASARGLCDCQGRLANWRGHAAVHKL